MIGQTFGNQESARRLSQLAGTRKFLLLMTTCLLADGLLGRRHREGLTLPSFRRAVALSTFSIITNTPYTCQVKSCVSRLLKPPSVPSFCAFRFILILARDLTRPARTKAFTLSEVWQGYGERPERQCLLQQTVAGFFSSARSGPYFFFRMITVPSWSRTASVTFPVASRLNSIVMPLKSASWKVVPRFGFN